MKQVSVVIATSGKRKNELVLTLNKLMETKDLRSEILVINQGEADFKEKVLNECGKNIKVRWFNQHSRGKSRALNFGFAKANGAIIVVIDDDVVVSQDWLKVIRKEFEDGDVGLVLGQIKAYSKQVGDNKFCPSTTVCPKRRLLTMEKLFTLDDASSGSIMAIRAEVISEVGGFCDWLGAGSPVHGGEDWEFCYRMAVLKRKVVVTPELVVFHNKLLDWDDFRELMKGYCMGMTALSFYLGSKYREKRFLENWIYWQKLYGELFMAKYKNDKMAIIKGYLEIVSIVLPGAFSGLYNGLIKRKHVSVGGR